MAPLGEWSKRRSMLGPGACPAPSQRCNDPRRRGIPSGPPPTPRTRRRNPVGITRTRETPGGSHGTGQPLRSASERSCFNAKSAAAGLRNHDAGPEAFGAREFDRVVVHIQRRGQRRQMAFASSSAVVVNVPDRAGADRDLQKCHVAHGLLLGTSRAGQRLTGGVESIAITVAMQRLDPRPCKVLLTGASVAPTNRTGVNCCDKAKRRCGATVVRSANRSVPRNDGAAEGVAPIRIGTGITEPES